MNYAELQTLIANTLNRQDLTANIPMFIALAEAQMDRELVTRQEFGLKTLSGAVESIGLPCDFGGVLALTAYGQPNRKVVYMAPDMLDEQWLSSNGAPHYYTVTQSQILLSPSVEFDGLLRYWKRLPKLSKDCPTNWLLDRHPDAYLYGALVHSAPFLKDDDRIGVWNSFFASAVQAINQQSVAQQAGSHVEIQSRYAV